jgi:LemA protein
VVLSLVFYTTLVLVVVGIALYVGGAFNQMVQCGREADRAFANVEVILKQRHDEIPRLVELCRAHMEHEKITLEEVVRLRTDFTRSGSVDSKVETANHLERQVSRIFGLAEAYPELKANELFRDLRNRLTTLENTIADRRELFNAAVTAYNTFIETFPAVLVARVFSFSHRTLLGFPASEVTGPPDISLNR